MPNLDYYNTARMHQMVNSFQDIVGDGLMIFKRKLICKD